MPEIYNANPTVFATSKASKSSRVNVKSLWPDDADDSNNFENDIDEPEPIDAGEIFGMHVLLVASFGRLTVRNL